MTGLDFFFVLVFLSKYLMSRDAPEAALRSQVVTVGLK